MKISKEYGDFVDEYNGNAEARWMGEFSYSKIWRTGKCIYIILRQLNNNVANTEKHTV